MNREDDLLVRNISDTARWVAVFRADESERKDAVFHDPFARQLAGERGEQIANAIPFSKENSWSFVARTWLIDQCIQQHVSAGFDAVLNLAAGLDARPWRMDLPASLQWFDVDLPEILRYKRGILANEKPKCRLQTIELDLSDQAARKIIFGQINEPGKKILVVTEGLLCYLEEEQAAELSKDLSSCASFRNWVFDLMSPGLLKIVQMEMNKHLEAAKSPLKLAPALGEQFFLPYGWKHVSSKSILKTAAQLNRLSGALLAFSAVPEPEGPKGEFPWTGVCLFENLKTL